MRLAILVEGLGISSYSQSVFVFRAGSRDETFSRALALGRNEETSYKNPFGEEVRWRLIKVETLDQLRGNKLDGREVYSEFSVPAADDTTPFDIEYRPEDSKPGQSGV